MPKTEVPDRPSVTSDPDRGVAVNSGTDPQTAGEAGACNSRRGGRKDPGRAKTPGPRPSSRNEDVEHGGRNEPDDPV